MAEYPSEVRIREVGPRDGFQNEPEVIPTAENPKTGRLVAMAIAKTVRQLASPVIVGA